MGHRASVDRLIPLGTLLAILSLTAPAHGALGDEASSAAPAIESIESLFYGPSLLDRFRRPRGLVADSAHGVFLISDTGNSRIVTFDKTGRSRGAVRYDPTGESGGIIDPAAFALDRRGRMFVVDVADSGVEVLSPRGSHLGILQPPLPAELQDLTRPTDIAIGASGRIYLLCSGTRSGALILEPDGRLVRQIGFPETDTGTWIGPISIAVDPSESEIVILDPKARHQIAVYGVDGSLLSQFGEHGEGEGTFSMAVHAVYGPGETLWVTDTIRHSISVFDSRGGYRGRIGGYGEGPGQFYYPAACAFLAEDQVVVLERAGSRCQVINLDVSGLPSTLGGSATAEP